MKTIRSMLKHLFLAVPLMLIVSCNSQPPSTLIPHRCENGKFGYVDEKGKEWIEGKYDYAEEFSEDLAVVQVGRYFGYIDRKGEIVIPLQYTQAAYFLQGRALVAKRNCMVSSTRKTGKSFPVFMNVSRRLPHTKPMR